MADKEDKKAKAEKTPKADKAPATDKAVKAERAAKAKADAAARASGGAKGGEREPEPKGPSRLRKQFDEVIRKKLMEQFGYRNPMQVPRIDKVVVITGRDKGRSGEVIEVRPAANRALVRGIHMVKRHQKQSATQEGGIVSKESSVHLSNLALADPKDGKPTRVGFKIVGDRKVRFAKRSGVEIDG